MSKTLDFHPKDWFKQLFGFEEDPKTASGMFDLIEEDDKVPKDFPPSKITLLKSKVNKKTYNSGNFQLRSSDKESFPNLKKRKNGKLNIIHGTGKQTKNYELIDILSMQSLPTFNGATYLAASNFNCLEFVSRAQTAENGVTDYYADPTQGPYAALACGPSIVYRNYFVKHHDHIGQIGKEINLLEKTGIPVVHGYAMIKKDTDIVPDTSPEQSKSYSRSFVKWFSNIFKKKEELVIPEKFKDPKNWQVGVHRNCEVVLTRNREGMFSFAPPGRVSHHVYAAAFNFAYDVTLTNLTAAVSVEMLTAEYRATILAAWENSLLYPDKPGSMKLSLTLLGGGVFANPYDVICKAIEANIELIRESGLDVYITCFNDQTFNDVMRYLGEAVKKTGGKIYNADDDENCKELLVLHDI